jgi:HK97 gp10 family phage protein
MSFVETTVESEADLLRLVNTVSKEAFARVQQVLYNGAIRIAERARDFAPVRTGRLLLSIHTTGVGTLEEPDEAFTPVGIVADAPYAGYVEGGTSKMAAQPFMQPALDEIRPQLLREIRTAIDNKDWQSVPSENTEDIGGA